MLYRNGTTHRFMIYYNFLIISDQMLILDGMVGIFLTILLHNECKWYHIIFIILLFYRIVSGIILYIPTNLFVL